MKLERTVHSTVEKAHDLEVHVSTLTTERGDYTEIREYVPSLQAYGRGITFPKELSKSVKDGLAQAGKKS